MSVEFETAEEYRKAASENFRRKEESFQRCDTDGFLSQWALGINAELMNKKADILDNDCMDTFIGLYEGNRRVKAKMIVNIFDGYRVVHSWFLHKDEEDLIARRGKPFLPTGNNSRILKNLGLNECKEFDKAWAKIDVPAGAKSTGLSGCANAFVRVYRCGDIWGGDTKLIKE